MSANIDEDSGAEELKIQEKGTFLHVVSKEEEDVAKLIRWSRSASAPDALWLPTSATTDVAPGEERRSDDSAKHSGGSPSGRRRRGGNAQQQGMQAKLPVVDAGAAEEGSDAVPFVAISRTVRRRQQRKALKAEYAAMAATQSLEGGGRNTTSAVCFDSTAVLTTRPRGRAHRAVLTAISRPSPR